MNDLGSNGQGQSNPPARWGRFGLNPWLQVLLLVIAMVVVVMIGWAIFNGVRHVILLLGASLLLAFLLGSLVDRFERHMHRGLGIALAYLLFLALTLLLLWILVNPFISQLRELAKTSVSSQIADFSLLKDVASSLSQFGITVSAQELEDQIVVYVKDHAAAILTNLTGIVTGIVSLSTDLLVVLAMSIFMLLDGRSLNNRVLRLLPDGPRESMLFIEATLSRAVGGFARGQILVATIVGFLAFGGSLLLGVHYPAVIGVAAFVFEFIPLLGPILGMLVAMLIAALQPWPLVLWVFIYFVIVQQVESNVIVPRISGGAVGLHPLGVLVVILAGVELGGLLGALVAVPLAGVLTVFGMALYLDIRGRTHLLISGRHAPARAPTTPVPPASIMVAATSTTNGDSQPMPQSRKWGIAHRPAATTSQAPPDLRGAELLNQAPPAALMFLDQLRVVLKEQDHLRSTYETYEARQSAVERHAQGLPEAERVAVERSDLQLPDIPG